MAKLKYAKHPEVWRTGVGSVHLREGICIVHIQTENTAKVLDGFNAGFWFGLCLAETHQVKLFRVHCSGVGEICNPPQKENHSQTGNQNGETKTDGVTSVTRET